MATLSIPDEQVVTLIRQLRREQKAEVLTSLLMDFWPEWLAGSEQAVEKARAVARTRGRDWDAMSEDERERFVDDVLHEQS